jgi:PKD repeat protein
MHLSCRIAALAACLGTVSVAQNQIQIPPHVSVYNGFSRGFSFTALNNFIITGLDLPPDAFQAGDTAGYLVQVNGVEVLRSVGNAGAITTSLIINPGDAVDIVGNWSPATTSNFSAHNSYGSGGGTFATLIEGVSTVLFRSGWQYDIGDPNYQSGAFLAPTTGSIGRVLVSTAPPSGLYPNISSDVTTGSSPLTVNFTDQTFTSDPNGVVAWAWDFDKNVNPGVDSTSQNPTWVYNQCGTYDVELTVTDATHGTVSQTFTAYVTTDTVAAGFTYQVVAPGIVQFTDTTTPPATSWAWDFDGDGVTDSTQQNPFNPYPAGTGLVNCSLTASRLCGPADTYTESIIPATNILTTFAAGNGLSASGAGNVFDVTVLNPNGITITELIMTPWLTAAGPFSVDVYLTDDDSGYANNHANQPLWRLVASGNATSATASNSGAPVQIGVPLTAPLHIAPGSYSMALHVNGGGVVYTTGNGTNQSYGNADLTLFLGGGKGAPFATGMNNPRVWNGGFIYDNCTSGTPPAALGFLGTGCAGSLGVSSLTGVTPPAFGGAVSIDVDNLPLNLGFLLIGFDNQTSPLGQLPLDLTSLGAAGCKLHTSIDLTWPLAASNNQANFSLNVPIDPTLACIQMHYQAFVPDLGANGLNAVLSDAATSIIGN